MRLGGNSRPHGGTFDFVVLKVVLGSFGALVSKARNSRRATRIAKRSEICDSGVVVACIWDGCLFDLLVSRWFQGHSVPLP